MKQSWAGLSLFEKSFEKCPTTPVPFCVTPTTPQLAPVHFLLNGHGYGLASDATIYYALEPLVSSRYDLTMEDRQQYHQD